MTFVEAYEKGHAALINHIGGDPGALQSARHWANVALEFSSSAPGQQPLAVALDRLVRKLQLGAD